MTDSERLAHAVTALRVARETANSSGPAPTTFLVNKDNGGSYHWTIVAPDGATLARSEGFTSSEAAEQAARRVRDVATTARFEHHGVGASPVDLTGRRDVASDDDDAERWLDEGGSFSSEAVTRWPAER